jgi:hypothetical protein
MGINRWSGGTEERKRNETDAKAGDKVSERKKGDTSSRLRTSRNRPRTRRSARSSRSSRRVSPSVGGCRTGEQPDCSRHRVENCSPWSTCVRGLTCRPDGAG